MNADLTKLHIPNKIGHLLGGLRRQPLEGPYRAALSLSPDGVYTIRINEKKFATSTPDQKQMIVIHELMHLAHGHLPYAVLHKLDPVLWNIAADAWINQAWPEELVASLGGVTCTTLSELLPNLPPQLVGPRVYYDALVKAMEGTQIRMSITTQDQLSIPDELTPEGRANATLQQLVTINRIQEAINDSKLPDHLRKRLRDLLAGASPTGSHREHTKGGQAVIPCEWLAAILNRLRGHSIHGDYRRTRGWYRQGRTEGVAGSRQAYGPLVLIAIDVSGSTCAYWESFIAAATMLSQRYRLRVVVYADTILFKGRTIPATGSPTGGGTLFNLVFRHADALGAHFLVNITDGENFDKDAVLSTCPIAWVYTPDHTAHSLRSIDMALQLGLKPSHP